MPPGRPTKVQRLPVDLLERLTADANTAGMTVAELIEVRCYPERRTADRRAAAATATRLSVCTCPKPVLSRIVSNLCTLCHGVRR